MEGGVLQTPLWAARGCQPSLQGESSTSAYTAWKLFEACPKQHPATQTPIGSLTGAAQGGGVDFVAGGFGGRLSSSVAPAPEALHSWPHSCRQPKISLGRVVGGGAGGAPPIYRPPNGAAAGNAAGAPLAAWAKLRP